MIELRVKQFPVQFATEENPRGVIAKVLDCDLEVSKFELQSPYY